jgi:hypothetical protein
MKTGAVNSVPKGGNMTVSYIYIIATLIYIFGNKTVDGANEIFTITNFLLACGITSICSRLDDLKRK